MQLIEQQQQQKTISSNKTILLLNDQFEVRKVGVGRIMRAKLMSPEEVGLLRVELVEHFAERSVIVGDELDERLVAAARAGGGHKCLAHAYIVEETRQARLHVRDLGEQGGFFARVVQHVEPLRVHLAAVEVDVAAASQTGHVVVGHDQHEALEVVLQRVRVSVSVSRQVGAIEREHVRVEVLERPVRLEQDVLELPLLHEQRFVGLQLLADLPRLAQLVLDRRAVFVHPRSAIVKNKIVISCLYIYICCS